MHLRPRSHNQKRKTGRDRQCKCLKAAQEKKYIVTPKARRRPPRLPPRDRVFRHYGHPGDSHSAKQSGELVSVMNRYPVTDLTVPNQSLEEIFMQYFGVTGIIN